MRTAPWIVGLACILALTSLVASASAAPQPVAQLAQQQPPADPPQAPPPDVDIHVTETTERTVWFADPFWITVGVAGAVVVILLIVLAGRGGGTTVIKAD